MLTAMYSLLASSVRIAGGVLSDRLYQGGYNTSILAVLIMLAGALVMTTTREFELAVPGVILLAIGMGICNAAVFKVVPQVVPQAIGGAAGWIGGIGALGGFVIPPAMAFAVRDLGDRGYSIGFVVFVFLALLSLAVAWVLKYGTAAPTVAPSPGASRRRRPCARTCNSRPLDSRTDAGRGRAASRTPADHPVGRLARALQVVYCRRRPDLDPFRARWRCIWCHLCRSGLPSFSRR